MKIKQLPNGSILIADSKNNPKHILPLAYLHKHPIEKNSILISSTTNYEDLRTGITLKLSEITDVDYSAFGGHLSRMIFDYYNSKSQEQTVFTGFEPYYDLFIEYSNLSTVDDVLSWMRKNYTRKSETPLTEYDSGWSKQEFYAFEVRVNRRTIRFHQRFYFRYDKQNKNVLIYFNSNNTGSSGYFLDSDGKIPTYNKLLNNYKIIINDEHNIKKGFEYAHQYNYKSVLKKYYPDKNY